MGNTQRKKRESTSLKEIFGSSVNLDPLRNYLISVYSIEYVLFLDKYFDYLDGFEKKLPYEKILSNAKNLEYTFICPSSPFSLNLSGKTVKKVSSTMNKAFSKKGHSRNSPIISPPSVDGMKDRYRDLYTVFDAVYEEVILILKCTHTVGYQSYLDISPASMSLPSISQLMKDSYKSSDNLLSDEEDIYVV